MKGALIPDELMWVGNRAGHGLQPQSHCSVLAMCTNTTHTIWNVRSSY